VQNEDFKIMDVGKGQLGKSIFKCIVKGKIIKISKSAAAEEFKI
jgi:hypothetical protein